MRLIDRYLFRQLLGPTLVAMLALGAIALLSQSLTSLDLVVDKNQSAALLGKVVLLGLPQLVSLVLPVAVLIAALTTLNRLHGEHELVVCYAGGMSRWRTVSPVVRVAVLATLLGLAVNLFVQPWAQRALRDELFAVRNDLNTSLVREGEFIDNGGGLTLYAERVAKDGTLTNVFVLQDKQDGSTVTSAAREGRIAQDGPRPVLVMRAGSNESLDRAGTLNSLRFDEYILDLTEFVKSDERVHYKPSDRWLHELMVPDLQQDWETKNRVKLLAEGHARLATPLYCLAFVGIALVAVVAGPFTRLGYGRRMAAAGGWAAGLRILGFVVQAACNEAAALNALQYALPLVVFAGCMAPLLAGRHSARPMQALQPLRPLTPATA